MPGGVHGQVVHLAPGLGLQVEEHRLVVVSVRIRAAGQDASHCCIADMKKKQAERQQLARQLTQ